MKKGRFSKEEMEFIEQNCEVLSPDSIAQSLDRSPESIKDWIANIGFDRNDRHF